MDLLINILFFVCFFYLALSIEPVLAMRGRPNRCKKFLGALREFMKGKERKERILRDIPCFLDLLVLSCEAGMDVFAAITSVMDNFQDSPLKDIFGSIIRDVRMGKSRNEALRKAYKNNNIWDIRTILMTVMQSDRLGTPIGRALRAQSDQMRRERLNRAESMAQKVPFKLMIPLLFLIFPVTFIVLLAPLILRFLKGSLF